MAGVILGRVTWRWAALFTFEGVLIAGAIAAGVQLRFGTEAWAISSLAARVMIMTAVCQLCLYWQDLYAFRAFDTASDVIVRVLQATAAMAVVFAALVLVIPALIIGGGVFITGGVLTAGVIVVWRLSFEWCSRRLAPRERILLVGSSVSAAELVADLRGRTDRGVDIVGMIPQSSAPADTAIPNLGTLEDLPAIVRARSVDRVVVDLVDARGKLSMDKLLEMRLDGVRFEHLGTVYERFTGRIAVEHLRPSALIFADGFTKSRMRRAIKRACDVAGSLVGLAIALPVMALVAAAVRLTSRGPILYRQRRVGQYGRIFTLRKFRSMREDAEAATGAVWAERSDTRVTPIGHLLRKSHLDELPQLVNILSGDMSLVGPRPERPEFVGALSRTIPFYGLRHFVRPGLTGWAQVYQNYASSADDSLRKLQYDLFYIKHMSLGLDALVALRTIKAVVQGRGV